MSTEVIKRLRERGLLEIVQRHAESHHVTVADVCSRWRHKSAASARHEAWREIRATTDLSYPEIGAIFGRNHTTIMGACKGVAKASLTLQSADLLAMLKAVVKP